jgi:DNA-binding Xre family transcriptional regulator
MKLKREVIDNWIAEHNPNGLFKLANKSGLSTGSITNARLNKGLKKPMTIRKLCKALGVSKEDLVLEEGEAS